jgi:hypothetical protein
MLHWWKRLWSLEDNNAYKKYNKTGFAEGYGDLFICQSADEKERESESVGRSPSFDGND